MFHFPPYTLFNRAHVSRDYNPMRLQGSIILGTGGDDSQGAQGVFFEGAMVTGFVSAELEGAVQANIVAAGYGR